MRCHVNISNFFKFINYCCVCIHTYAHACAHLHAGTHAPHSMYAGQGTTSRSWCSPSSVCLGIGLRLLGLAREYLSLLSHLPIWTSQKLHCSAKLSVPSLQGTHWRPQTSKPHLRCAHREHQCRLLYFRIPDYIRQKWFLTKYCFNKAYVHLINLVKQILLACFMAMFMKLIS